MGTVNNMTELDQGWNSFCADLLGDDANIKECHIFMGTGQQGGSSTSNPMLRAEPVTIKVKKEDDGETEMQVDEQQHLIKTLMSNKNGGSVSIDGQQILFSPTSFDVPVAEGITQTVMQGPIKMMENGWALCFIRTNGTSVGDDYEGNFEADNYLVFLKWEKVNKTIEFFKHIYANLVQEE